MLGNGVHLNKTGMGRYRKQIRKCVRHYVKKKSEVREVLSFTLVVVGFFYIRVMDKIKLI